MIDRIDRSVVVSPVLAVGKADPGVALPTKLVTLYGGRVYVNEPPVTQTEDCLAKF